jgi:hypothetical protein
MPLHGLIGKSLEKWADRRERRDEELADIVLRNMEALSDRRNLKIYISVLAGINAVIWLCVIAFPSDVEDAWQKVDELDQKITAVMIAIIFGVGFWLTYTLFRLGFPDIEDQTLDRTFLSSFDHSQRSLKRFRVWVASAAGGVLNVLALTVVEILMARGL